MREVSADESFLDKGHLIKKVSKPGETRLAAYSVTAPFRKACRSMEIQSRVHRRMSGANRTASQHITGVLGKAGDAARTIELINTPQWACFERKSP